MEKFKKYIKYIDFFGKNTTLLFKNDVYYTTCLGIFFSFMLIIFSIIAGIYFVFLDDSNTIIISHNIRDSSPLNFQKQSFFVAILMENLVNSSDITFIFKNKSQVIKSIEFSKFESECGSINVMDSNIFCLNFSKELEDHQIEEEMEIIIENKLSTYNNEELTIFYVDNIFDSSDPYNPIQKTTNIYNLQTLDNYSKTLTLTLEHNEVNTDFGILLNDFKQISFLKVQNIHETITKKKALRFSKLELKKASQNWKPIEISLKYISLLQIWEDL